MASTVIAWGNNASGQTNIPPGLRDIVAVAGSDTHNLAIHEDGTLVSWGDNSYAKVSGAEGRTGISRVAAGAWHSMALTRDGRVLAWGQSDFGQMTIPVGLSDVVEIAAGSHHCLALTSSGRVAAWGYNTSEQTTVPLDLASVVSVAAGYSHSLALKSDGTVVSWGSMSQTNVPAGLTNVAAIAAGLNHNLALKLDGRVSSWGSMNQNTVPIGLSNVVEVAAGNDYSLALKDDGTVVSWGNLAPPPGLTNVVTIAAGWSHALALIGDQTNSAPFILGPFGGRANTSTPFTFRVLARGTSPLHYQWRKNGIDLPAQANSLLTVNSIQFSDEGGYSVVVSNSFGVVTSRVARLSVVDFGAPEIRSDWETLIDDVIRGDQSTISMFTPFSNGTIFYTTDGSEPDFTSTPYLGPFLIRETTTLRAIAYSQDFTRVAEDGPFQIQIIPTYALNKSSSGQGVVSVFPDTPRYIRGTIVTLWAFPAVGSHFVRWEGEACGPASGASILMDANKSVTAVFEANPAYTLAASSTGGGTISGNTGNPYPEGRNVSIIAHPSPGWRFVRWEGDASGPTTNLVVTMDRPKAVRAVFATDVATSVGGPGTLALQPSQGPYPYGSTVRISPRPNSGSYFAVWGSSSSGRVFPLDFVVTNANPIVSALFASLQGNDVNIYINVDGEGTVSATPNQQPYPTGTPVMLTATASPGWRFVEWRGDITGTIPNVTVTLATSKSVTAVFQALPKYPFTATTLGGGVVIGNNESLYPEGTIVGLTAVPAPGWQFLSWEGETSATTSNLSITIDAPKSTQAIFGTAIKTNIAGNGSLMVSPPQGPYPYGSVVRLTATPKPSASFSGWGNFASGSENPLAFVVNTANPAICAFFMPGPNSAPPAITGQPLSQSVIVSGEVTFRVTVSGASPFNFQWRKNEIPIGGAGTSSLLLRGVTTNDAGAYDVVVSNPYGSATSTVAMLTVALPPTIVIQPTDQIVQSGTIASFSVLANGSQPFTYQWHKAGGPIPTGTNQVFAIQAASTNDTGDYHVVVSSPYGTATSQPRRLTVFDPVLFAVHPIQQIVPLRGTATFNALATGYPPPSYQWLFQGQPISGANNSGLVLTNVGTNFLGQYSVRASNAYSAATSVPALLLMSPSLRMPYLGATVVWGKNASIAVSAVGSGDLTYQWFKDGVAIPSGTDAALNFPAVQLTDAGLYSVVVTSQWGTVTNTPAQLVVNPANIALNMYAGVTIDGVPGFNYGIQYSTDLRNTNSWQTITNYTLTVPIETWIDFDSPGKPKRFYRVVVP